MKEKDLVKKYIKNQIQNNQTAQYIRELGYRQKKVDVVEYDPYSDCPLHGIEFKIKNWRIGFQQCLGNRDLIPYNSLALFHEFIKNVDITSLKEKGIGLISLEKNKAIQLIKPSKSEFLNPLKHNIFLRNLSKHLELNQELLEMQ